MKKMLFTLYWRKEWQNVTMMLKISSNSQLRNTFESLKVCLVSPSGDKLSLSKMKMRRWCRWTPLCSSPTPNFQSVNPRCTDTSNQGWTGLAVGPWSIAKGLSTNQSAATGCWWGWAHLEMGVGMGPLRDEGAHCSMAFSSVEQCEWG